MSGCNFKSSIGVWLRAVAAFGQARSVGLGDVIINALKCPICSMCPAWPHTLGGVVFQLVCFVERMWLLCHVGGLWLMCVGVGEAGGLHVHWCVG